MGKFKVVLTNTAVKDLEKHRKAGNKKDLTKIKIMLEEMEETPREGIGNPEFLSKNLRGFWSRRINKKDRLVYRIDNKVIIVVVLSAMGHYGDK